ncbi:MAG: DsbA family protein [Acidobacteriia bacterium]|nr:DsbA family protein [Terriglobia bacterium]
MLRRSLIAFLLFCLGCAAQANSPELNQRIERHVRLYLSGKIPPTVGIKAGARTPSADFPNYDKITVTLSEGERKQDLEFLISKDGSSLVRVTKFDLTKDPYAEIMKKIDLTGRPVRGNKDAKVTIVNFDDFQCPFCSRMHAELMQGVLRLYGPSVRIVYKDYPLSEIHPWASHAAVNANCLAAQSGDAYWDFADYAHANQKQITGAQQTPPYTAQFQALDRAATAIAQRHNLQVTPLLSCLKAQSQEAVAKSLKDGASIGVEATPFLFINGERVDGALPLPELQAVINRALRDAGQPIPPAAMASAAQPGSAPQGDAAPEASSAPATNPPPASSAAPTPK